MECILRFLGFQPWRRIGHPKEPVLLESDAVLGWKSKEGFFSYCTSPGTDSIHITVVPEGRRVTEPDESGKLDQRAKIVLVGGSWTYGWALSDEDTFGWKIQERFKDKKVMNLGVGGYGTYQSLLVLEQKLHEWTDVDIVLYGFITHHELRNVAAAKWLRGLSRNSVRGHVSVPYVTLEQDRLLRHPPVQYPSWLGRKDSALIALLEQDWVRLQSYQRTRQAPETTQQLLLEMKQLVEKHQSHFLVVMFRELSFKEDKHFNYVNFMKKNKIDYVDCEKKLDESSCVIGDGHPNGAFNTYWAEQIVPKVEAILESTKKSNHTEKP
ncbi:MAG: SGNH/GDSL hydrolase family protein [Sedimentisphaerales bacterium]|nr:SGNH/GDSL hydrolase family protein [Sedimentisphaerales bacterium]